MLFKADKLLSPKFQHSIVINFDFPKNSETYLHRFGGNEKSFQFPSGTERTVGLHLDVSHPNLLPKEIIREVYCGAFHLVPLSEEGLVQAWAMLLKRGNRLISRYV
ncbi:hypothetical protein Ahy_A01g003069 isoform B [Arachis hypogaea]|uniref:Helicase C-terminal domain-containing protein n=1 Tax=Arachis hypogaea TaxID=3818 RepID=A0A445ESL6_ARAHY|nr:hypothetical protein Ahy_A01g003069 isoform B [Arachis hypogaea]